MNTQILFVKSILWKEYCARKIIWMLDFLFENVTSILKKKTSLACFPNEEREAKHVDGYKF